MSSYEVELKFHADDHDSLSAKLQELGASSLGSQEHRDTYYGHPCRDFAETREALRVRRIDGQPMVTYKGAKLPGIVKTRIELEWDLAPGDPSGENMESLLVHLGFRRVAEVVKRRESFAMRWNEHDMTITLDDVENVGRFSEIERLAEKDSLDQAQTDVLSLAEELGLSDPEPRSYLRMLLENKD